MKANPSNEPVVENAQHDPHEPWFLTGVTAPFYLQSTVYGRSPTFSAKNSLDSTVVDAAGECEAKQPISFLNSSLVKSEN